MRPYSLQLLFLVLSNIVLGAIGALTMAVIKPVMGVLFEEGANRHDILPDVSGLHGVKDSLFSTIDSLIVSPQPSQTLLNLSLFIVSIFVVKNILKYVSGIRYIKLSETVVRDMRLEVFRRLLDQPLSFFNASKVGELLSLTTNEIGAMHATIVPFFMQMLRHPVEVILLLLLLLSLSVKLTLIAMSTTLVTMFLVRIARTFLRRYAGRMADSTAGFIGTLQESLSSIRVVKAFSAETKVLNRFAQHTDEYVRSAVKLSRVNESIPTINEILAIGALSVVLLVGGHEVFSGEMRGSDLMTFLFGLFAIMSPVISLVSVPGQIQRGLVAADRVFALMDRKAELEEGSIDAPPFRKELVVENVRFSYNEHRVVLDKVSLRVPFGKKVALVGASGSGKSTLIDLLVRFYDPQQGSVLMDGEDIRRFKTGSYRRRFGVVSQEAVLFNDTIANNIGFGLPNISKDDVVRAASIAHADEFIRALPQGYETLTGDRGVLLSGGQKQRIAIARAVALNPDILIFDEATSALDSESEKIVQDTMNELLRDRTAVIIAHRLSTIIHCDTIIVFDKGQIIEQGTHTELLARKGVYYRLYTLQYGQNEGGMDESR